MPAGPTLTGIRRRAPKCSWRAARWQQHTLALEEELLRYTISDAEPPRPTARPAGQEEPAFMQCPQLHASLGHKLQQFWQSRIDLGVCQQVSLTVFFQLRWCLRDLFV